MSSPRSGGSAERDKAVPVSVRGATIGTPTWPAGEGGVAVMVLVVLLLVVVVPLGEQRSLFGCWGRGYHDYERRLGDCDENKLL